MMAPGIPEIAINYGIRNQTVIAMTLSIFLLSFGIGVGFLTFLFYPSNANWFSYQPSIMAPLSEMYGRTWVLHISNLFSLAFSLGCAFAPNTGSFIAFRFLGMV